MISFSAIGQSPTLPGLLEVTLIIRQGDETLGLDDFLTPFG